MESEAIHALEIPAADDRVLFLWATVPMLVHALDAMRLWGFKYKSHIIWVKDKAGTGHWFRNKNELLLVGTGNIPAPAPGDQSEFAITIRTFPSWRCSRVRNVTAGNRGVMRRRRRRLPVTVSIRSNPRNRVDLSIPPFLKRSAS
jgi:N6-adenosine-specific RNA methylase IME4